MKVINQIRCVGEDRKKQAENLMIYGSTNVQSDNVLYNYENDQSKYHMFVYLSVCFVDKLLLIEIFKDLKVTNSKTLSKIKSEFVNRDKISNDVFKDAEAAKYIMDGLCLVGDSKFYGYIQEISLSPFGFILTSYIQVKD